VYNPRITGAWSLKSFIEDFDPDGLGWTVGPALEAFVALHHRPFVISCYANLHGTYFFAVQTVEVKIDALFCVNLRPDEVYDAEAGD